MTRSQNSMSTDTSAEHEWVTLWIEGDDVVAYGRDAEIVSEALGLTLMLERRDGRPAKLTGLKTILLDTYTIRLIDSGSYDGWKIELKSKTNKSSEHKSLSLYRRGDFLCAYGRDAEIAAEVLDLTITTERRSARQPLKMTGFPEVQVDSYTRQIASAGYRVAVLDKCPEETQ